VSSAHAQTTDLDYQLIYHRRIEAMISMPAISIRESAFEDYPHTAKIEVAGMPVRKASIAREKSSWS
jgi:hypothetical protein